MKVLVGVDGTKGTKGIFGSFANIIKSGEVILVHVQKVGGRSLMYEMLSDSELKTLSESLEGTEYKEKMIQNGEKVLAHYKKTLEGIGITDVRTVLREGNPVEEILKVAEKEGVDLIVMGCNGKKGLHRLFTGCTTKEVERNSKVPVLVAKSGGCDKTFAKNKAWEEEYAVR